MKPASHLPRFVRRATLGVAVALAVWVLVEAGLRLALGPPPSPTSVVQGMAGEGSYLSVSGGVATASYVRTGPGGPVYTFRAAAEGPRVVFLGASSVFGFNVGPSERFSALIADALGVEAVNLAAPAMESADLVRLVAELDAITLSAVVLYAGHNDVGNAWFMERYGGYAGAARAYGHRALGSLHTWSWLSRVLEPARPSRAASAPPAAMTPARLEAVADAFEANLRQIARRLAARGIPLVLSTPASNLTWRPADRACGAAPACPDALWSRATALQDSDPAEASRLFVAARDVDWASVRAPGVMAERVRAVAAASGATLVDAERDLPREGALDAPASRLFLDQLHFSREGHVAMAELLEPALREALAPP